MVPQFVVALMAAAVSVMAELNTHLVPLAALKKLNDAQCSFPSSFTINDFKFWKPDSGNTDDEVFYDFNYVDALTNVITPCHLNGSSQPNGPAGLTARWPCDNKWVQFIWKEDTNRLTLIEQACPTEEPGFEASGNITPTFSCTEEPDLGGRGPGQLCSTPSYSANFTSLEPIPMD
ncbi:hypothetical protein B0T17DRAFT_509488 [Bombardia bombarda]|uniref:AA1-like domain-containing protein n=1 Tax=Bombardia bombarda TaxID=252184 RepID=A0AA40BY35_9PEZI|nr:hypothetical protein B0T17DRAFT_509488 [Bombardia bombarda]